MLINKLYNIAITAIIFLISYLFAPYIINTLVDIKGLPKGARDSIVFIFSIQIFQVLEFIKFNLYEWENLKDNLKKFEIFHDKWDKSWGDFQDKWSKGDRYNKSKMLELSQSRSRTGSILDEFAKCNIIVESLHKRVKDDLELDNIITASAQDDQKEFHDFIFALKYDAFFNSHFKSKAKDKEVLKIPSYYFKKNIWQEFVDRAYCYYSIQLLVGKQAKEYLDDAPRMHGEINFLLRKSKGDNKTEIKKLFIIEDNCFGFDDKIADSNIKDYLSEWNDRFKDYYRVLPVKVLKKSQAYGLVGARCGELSDIGIFGNIYGEQSVVEKTKSNDELCFDDLQIDFYFDRSKTEKQKQIFFTLIEEAVMLSDVL